MHQSYKYICYLIHVSRMHLIPQRTRKISNMNNKYFTLNKYCMHDHFRLNHGGRFYLLILR